MNDKQIIQLLFQRDESGLEQIKKQYKAYYETIISQIIDSPEDCEECVSDVLIALWNSIPPNDPENLKGYIARTARNVAIARFRKNNAHIRTGDRIASTIEELQDIIPDKMNIENEIIFKELTDSINTFLCSRSERDRAIFINRYYYFRPAAEIAMDFHMGEGHVRMILSRIRKDLKKHLNMEGLL